MKPNLPVLGPKYGRDLQKIRQALETANPMDLVEASERGGQISIGEFTLEPDEILIERTGIEGYAVSVDAGYTAGVDTTLTAELEAEGTVREIVHHVQNIRKSAGLEIADRIDLFVNAPQELITPLRNYDCLLYTSDAADE